jgi:mannose-1-phosphate guanylyltransferase
MNKNQVNNSNGNNPKMNKNNYVAIMAGGIGSRFWPMSRTHYPKQFLDILNTGKTLLQSTYDRFASFIPVENIYIITSDDYVSIVKEQLLDLPFENIIGEPERKNTAPCVALIAFKLQSINPKANLIVAPSDHLIYNDEAFKTDCLKALAHTEKNNQFVTLGIQPTHANTGYGYIQFDATPNNLDYYNVKRFTEKPNKPTAIEFCATGNYLWNSGIFIWKANDIINAFSLYSKDLFYKFWSGSIYFNTAKEKEAITHIYKQCESISIDYAILEKAKNIAVIPASFDWSDLGTWNSAYENIEKDDQSNALAGNNMLMVDAKGCMVHSNEQKLVVVGGLDDLIIVNTKDALLICKKENEQDIKEYVLKLKETTGTLYL